MGPEVSAKTAILKWVVSSTRRRLFANEAIPVQKRLQHGRMLALSKGLFQAGAWPRLSTAQEMKVYNAYMGLLRAVSGDTIVSAAAPHASDADVIDKLSTMAPLVFIRMLRALPFARVVCHAPPVLLQWLSLEAKLRHGWLAVTFDGLKWLASASETLASLREASLAQWSTFSAMVELKRVGRLSRLATSLR